MIKSALGKVMWVGRATVFVVGLAVILAMVVELASTAGKATNLNADKIDGKDSTAFGPASPGSASRVPMWVVVNDNGTIARQSPEVVSVSKLNTKGWYNVTFDRDVSQCAFAATAYAHQGSAFATAGNEIPEPGGVVNKVRVETYSSVSNGRSQDSTFNLIVTC
jgi:hypothetical protein